MTMFSMKPKFDLAEFLAESARKGPRSKTKDTRRGYTPRAKAAPEAEKDTPNADK